MTVRHYIVWILILTVGWALAFGHFNKYFDGAELEKKKAQSLERNLRQQMRKISKLESRFSEYKDAMVASGIKIDNKTSWFDEKRNLASVISDSDFKSAPSWTLGKVSYDHAKKVFLSNNYRRSAELFEEFIQQYPDNPSLPMAQYLLGESYFLLGNTEGSLRSLNSLITHFPETEPACLGMVRLGKIFEKEERLDDAIEIYSLAAPLFPKSPCSVLASRYYKSLSL